MWITSALPPLDTVDVSLAAAHHTSELKVLHCPGTRIVTCISKPTYSNDHMKVPGGVRDGTVLTR